MYYLYLVVVGKSSTEKYKEAHPALKKVNIIGGNGDSWFSFLRARY